MCVCMWWRRRGSGEFLKDDRWEVFQVRMLQVVLSSNLQKWLQSLSQVLIRRTPKPASSLPVMLSRTHSFPALRRLLPTCSLCLFSKINQHVTYWNKFVTFFGAALTKNVILQFFKFFFHFFILLTLSNDFAYFKIKLFSTNKIISNWCQSIYIFLSIYSFFNCRATTNLNISFKFMPQI